MLANYPGDKIAQQAFAIMMQRGWWAHKSIVSGKWIVYVQGEPRMVCDQQKHDDPFTALCAAEAWYREHCEEKQP